MPDTQAPRHDGWTPARQRLFLESLASDGLVRRAARAAGMSHEAAYQLRRRAEGAAFALGWDAALLLARTSLADTLHERAIEGQEEIVTYDPDTHTRTRHRHDNRLAMSLLGRLDRFADRRNETTGDLRLIAGDWDAFLELVDRGDAGSAAALFLAARRPADGDLETSGPCQLCGQEPPAFDDADDAACGDDDCPYLIWDAADGHIVTDFPPPADFDGVESGTFGSADYWRDLSSAELAIELAWRDGERAQRLAVAEAHRARIFESARLDVAAWANASIDVASGTDAHAGAAAPETASA